MRRAMASPTTGNVFYFSPNRLSVNVSPESPMEMTAS